MLARAVTSTITWMRRTRIGGDSWETPDVPLGEDTERYEVDILDGATVKRTLAAAASPSVTYTRRRADRRLRHRAAARNQRLQMSAAYGRGTPRAAAV